jgi:hypothetical protein
MLPRWRAKPLCIDQVAGAKDSQVNLTPANPALAAAVKANWAAWLPNQTVPLIWERVLPDAESCDDQ